MDLALDDHLKEVEDLVLLILPEFSELPLRHFPLLLLFCRQELVCVRFVVCCCQDNIEEPEAIGLDPL